MTEEREVGAMVGALIAEVEDAQDELLAALVVKIRTLHSGFLRARPGRLDPLELVCRRDLADVLVWIRQEGLPAPGELESRRRGFSRGARSGVLVTDVLGALRLGFQALWLHLATVAAQHGVAAAPAVQLLTERMWAVHDLLATLATDAHLAASRESDLARQRNMLEFWALIGHLPSALDTAEAAARRLRLDPSATFVAWAHDHDVGPRMRAMRGTHEVHLRDVVIGFATVEPQPGDGVADLRPRIAELRASYDGAVGVGMPRPGLIGLGQSATDARRTLAVARRRGRGIVEFADAWLAALALDDSLGLAPLVKPAEYALHDDPILIAALETFLRHAGRLRPTARSLDLHPNTLAYRLDRYSAKAGTSPSTLAGSLLTAFALVRAGDASLELDLSPQR